MADKRIPRLPGESEHDFKRRRWNEWDNNRRRALGIEPKRKNFGQPCSEDGCDAPCEIKGMCGRHYRSKRLTDQKALGIKPEGKRAHPLYVTWFERKKRGSLCAAWEADFWLFVSVVGDRPSPKHLLRRISTKTRYDAGNWEWIDALKREPGETKKDFNARKWASRREREPEYESRRWLMRKYGLTPEQYEDMYVAQGGVCATCKQPETSVHHHTLTPKALAVDHCHATGVVRGLLCWSCNSTLGRVKDSPDLLRELAAYLEKPR